MAAKVIYKKKDYPIRHGMSIRSAMLQLGIQPEAVIPTKNGELVTDDELIEEGDVVKLVAVISGG